MHHDVTVCISYTRDTKKWGSSELTDRHSTLNEQIQTLVTDVVGENKRIAPKM